MNDANHAGAGETIAQGADQRHGASEQHNADKWITSFATIALGVTLFRVIVLLFAQHELGPDETQYWFWSQTPDFGYFSKPPLIAWVIAASTGVFGDSAWAVRLPAPAFHAMTGLCLFLLGRRLFDSQTGFWSGVTWLLIPGVTISSSLMSTDALMLFFWSAGMYCFFTLATASASQPIAARWPYALGLGAALGLGFLAKYAIIYFPLGVVATLIVAPSLRRRFTLADGAIAAVTASIIVAPNIWWNAQHDFQTLSHTAANANWGADLFHPGELAEFLGAQFGVAGPLTLIVMIAATIAAWRAEENGTANKDIRRALTCFTAPILMIICIQAFLSRAHANWAAAAYPAATVLASAFAVKMLRESKVRHWMNAVKASAIFHAGAVILYSAAIVSPAFADGIGLAGAFKRLRGWEAQGAAVAKAADGYDAIMTGDREIMGGLLYYARAAQDGNARFVAWDSNHSTDHHYEAFLAYDPTRDKRVLYVTDDATAIQLLDRFASYELVDTLTVQLDKKRSRTLFLFDTTGHIPVKKPG